MALVLSSCTRTRLSSHLATIFLLFRQSSELGGPLIPTILYATGSQQQQMYSKVFLQQALFYGNHAQTIHKVECSGNSETQIGKQTHTHTHTFIFVSKLIDCTTPNMKDVARARLSAFDSSVPTVRIMISVRNARYLSIDSFQENLD